MQSYPRKLITVITEAALEATLTRDLDRLNAHGYTICDARGKGSHGLRNAGWEANSNIRVEVVCDEATAESIAEHLEGQYYRDYAMVLFMTDIAVIRPEKF